MLQKNDLKKRHLNIYMDNAELGRVLDYLKHSRQGNIKTDGGKEYKRFIINGVEYAYNKEKPITGKLKQKLEQIAKTNEYKKINILNKASRGIQVRKALQTFALKSKLKITEVDSAFKGYANSYSITNINMKGYKGLSVLNYQKPRLTEFLKANNSIKIRIDAHGNFKHPEKGEIDMFVISSRIYTVFNEEELKKTIDNMASDIEIKIENSQLKKSGYTLENINKIRIHYDKYNPTRAGKYIELPRWITLKKACINIKNEDEYCFKYCVQCRFYEIHKKDHPERLHHYNKLKEEDKLIKWNNVNFPTSNDDIDVFEENNENSISVNVYKINPQDEKSIIVERLTKISRPSCHINLLLIEEKGYNHYVLIKDYSRLMGAQTNKHKTKLFHCMYCQKGFQQEKLLNNHIIKGCLANEVQSTEMPEEYEKMSFKNHCRKLKCPYVIYGDFECLTTETTDGIKGTYDYDSNPKPLKGTYQNHTPCGFMLNVVNSITNEATPYLYRGEDCMDKFCSTMNKIREEILRK